MTLTFIREVFPQGLDLGRGSGSATVIVLAFLARLFEGLFNSFHVC